MEARARVFTKYNLKLSHVQLYLRETEGARTVNKILYQNNRMELISLNCCQSLILRNNLLLLKLAESYR